jgi:hypothetical protein
LDGIAATPRDPAPRGRRRGIAIVAMTAHAMQGDREPWFSRREWTTLRRAKPVFARCVSGTRSTVVPRWFAARRQAASVATHGQSGAGRPGRIRWRCPRRRKLERGEHASRASPTRQAALEKARLELERMRHDGWKCARITKTA